MSAFTVLIIQTVLFGLGLTLALIRIKHLSALTRLVGLFFLLALLSELASFLLFYVFRINPNYGTAAYLILSAPVYSLIYYYALGKQHKTVFLLSSVFFIAGATVNLLFIQREAINSYSNILLTIMVIVYGLYYFYWLIKKLPTTQILKLPMFWINSAFIMYFSGNLFLFVFTAYLVNVLNNNLASFWTLHNLLGIVESIMLMASVWLDGRD